MTTDPTSVEVRALLARRGLTVTALAPCVDLTVVALRRRIAGKVPWTVDEVRRVAAALDVPVAALVPEQVSA